MLEPAFMIDLRSFLGAAENIVERHNLGETGRFARWLADEANLGLDLGVNPYGCADALNLLYTVGKLPPERERGAWIEVLRGFQDAEGGLFREATHDPIHTTAHCIAALELLDAPPRHPLRALEGLRDRAALRSYLDGLEWNWNPWGESHKGAGLYAAMVLAGEVGQDWQDFYFEWLWNESDPSSGLWRRGCVGAGGDALLFHHLAGSFHYLFNHEYARRPIPHPERMIDTCLRIREAGLFPPLGRSVGFAEVDWVYCLSRARRQSGYRFGDVRAALESFAREYVAFLFELDPHTDAGLNDLHQLFGAVCALAELQQAVPGLLRSERPLRLVLDRRPFI